PALAGHLVGVAVVAAFHDEVDADASVAVVVVVGLPDGPERIDRELVVVAEVVAEDLEVRAVRIAAERHPLAIRSAARVDDVAVDRRDRLAVLVEDGVPGVAVVPIALAVGPEDEAVERVVMLRLAALGEEGLLLDDLVVGVLGEDEDVRRRRDDDLVAED